MLLTLLACAAAPPPVAAPTLPTHHVVPDVKAALAVVLAGNPRVVGVGEIHSTTDGPAGPSTIARFTRDLLPVLAPRTTDLVIETWRLDEACLPKAEAVATVVQEETHRPEATKSELVLLVEAAVALGVRPHDLAIGCDEYTGLLDPGGALATDALLRLLTAKLQDYALRGLEAPDASIVLYGGAVHNDLYPRSEALAAYSYGVAAGAKGAGYVELDLYDPALLRASPALVEEAWAPLLEKVGPDHVVLVERGPRSWVLLLESAS